MEHSSEEGGGELIQAEQLWSKYRLVIIQETWWEKDIA